MSGLLVGGDGREPVTWSASPSYKGESLLAPSSVRHTQKHRAAKARGLTLRASGAVGRGVNRGICTKGQRGPIRSQGTLFHLRWFATSWHGHPQAIAADTTKTSTTNTSIPTTMSPSRSTLIPLAPPPSLPLGRHRIHKRRAGASSRTPALERPEPSIKWRLLQ